jgi:Concanavalin A-like lectin/glucanases superfamily/Secretion system C-terminal sorting domain
MRKIISVFFAVSLFSVFYAQDFSPSIAPLYTGPNWGSIVDTGITCTGGPNISIVRDDGTYENGYRSVSTGDSTTMVQKMVLPSTPMNLVQMCVVWTALSPSGNITFDLIIYDTTGAGGTAPGNVVYRVNNVVGNSVAIYPLHSRYSYPINFTATQRAYFVGVRWNNNPILPFFFSADENGPVSTMGPGYQRITTTYPPVWQNITSPFPLWKSWGIRLEGTAAGSSTIPDLFYYKFEQNPTPLTVLNCAIPGVGTSPSPLGVGTPLTTGGQFDTCISGTGLTTGKITTGWNTNLGTSSWTISMWLTIPTTSSGSAYYLFGDAGSGSFRCFHNGVALPDNLVLRGGFTDITVTGIGPAPTVVTFVYDSAAAQVRAYKNGVLATTVAQTLNIVTGTGFHVGGYGTSTSFVGKMDEFRMYRRALTPAQITAQWNSDLGGCGLLGINPAGTEIPSLYKLEQNYPNPFNPVTNIKFSIPDRQFVTLKIFDVLGRHVGTLVKENMAAGNYVVDFDASRLSSGVYFYQLEAGSFFETKKMLLVK